MSDNVKDQLEAMIAGTHEDTEIEEVETEQDTGVDDEAVAEESEDEEVTETVDNEDTDQDEETEEDEDTDQEIDESGEETLEESEDAEEEDAHETTDDESEQTDEIETEEETEVEEEVDTTDTTTTEPDEVDYKAFYEKVALAKFTANGREVEGFKNPEDLIRAQQMLHGYSDKMKVFKEYKKFLKPLEERAVTSDPDKFNLAMSLLDGDVEAIKKVIKEKGIDPLEMDLENIEYAPKNTLPSEAQMLIEEVATQARDLGVEDKFHRVLTKDFDDESLQEFVSNGAVRRDLIQHLQDGTYDTVQNEIRNMELLDSDGQLDSISTVKKYRIAVQRLSEKAAQKATITPKAVVKEPVEDVAKIESDRIAAEEFKKKAAEKEKKVAEDRKKAASVSKKRVVKQKTAKVKPEALKGDDFRDYFRDMMMK